MQIVTIKYNPSGGIVWQISFNDKYNYGDRPLDIAVDPAGNVVVAGQSMVAPDEWAYLTVKYVAHTLVMPVDSDSVSTSLRFLANRDQLLGTDGNAVERVRFYSNQCYPNVYMMDDSLSYVFAHIDDDTTTADTMHRVDMSFVGGNAEAKLLPIDKEAYFNNYYLGHIPEGRPFVSLYKHLYMQDVWTGIDMEYSSNQRGLKYYFIVHPSIEPSLIGLRYDGQDNLSVDGNGALVMQTTVGPLVQPQALAYEMDSNGELTLLGWQPDYVVSSGVVSFDGIGSYSGDLVIEVNWGYVGRSGGLEPGWSTFYGGTSNEMSYDIVTDELGNLYGGGETKSLDFPLSNAIQGNISGSVDAYVGGFDVNYEPLWMTYYGGGNEDRGFGVAFDHKNEWVYLCGSTGYPSASASPLAILSAGTGSYTNTFAQTTGFLARFLPSIGTLNWATSFGAGSEATCIDVECDALGNLYVIGHNSFGLPPTTTCSSTNNGSFPICNAASTSGVFLQSSHQGGHTRNTDAFIAKFSFDTQLLWSTLYGGDGDDYFNDLAMDNSYGKVYVVGQTESIFTNDDGCGGSTSPPASFMPLCDDGGYYQNNLNGDNISVNPGKFDGLIARFSQAGIIEWSTFFGGAENDKITGIAVLPQIGVPNKNGSINQLGDIVITGVTNTGTYGNTNCGVPTDFGFPSCDNGQYHVPFSGNSTVTNDLFIAQFSLSTALQWSTYFGGPADDDVIFPTGNNSWPFQGPKVAINSSGDKYLLGDTKSGSGGLTTIPTQQDPLMAMYFEYSHGDYALNLNSDCFVTRFDLGNQLDYSTLFGGVGADFSGGISLFSNRVYISGGTFSLAAFPLHEFDQSSSSLDYYQDYTTLPGSINGTVSDAFFAQIESSNILTQTPSSWPAVSGNGLFVYPNPTLGSFTMQWEAKRTGIGSYAIFNIQGEQIEGGNLRHNAGQNQTKFDLSEYPSGLYLLSFLMEGVNQSVKIIRQ